jgi:hypothetical protein
MPYRRNIALTIVLLGTVPAAARAAEEQPKPNLATQAVKESAKTATQEISDSWITLKTKLALLADERVSSRQVHVSTRQAVITLRGKVGNEEARQAAEEVALKIEGAKKVHNQLVVVPQAAREVVDRKDDQIVRDVEGKASAARGQADRRVGTTATNPCQAARRSPPA